MLTREISVALAFVLPLVGGDWNLIAFGGFGAARFL